MQLLLTPSLQGNFKEISLIVRTLYSVSVFFFPRLSLLSVVCKDFVSSSPKLLVKNYDDVHNIVDVLCNNVDEAKLMVIKEHLRLVLYFCGGYLRLR